MNISYSGRHIVVVELLLGPLSVHHLRRLVTFTELEVLTLERTRDNRESLLGSYEPDTPLQWIY